MRACQRQDVRYSIIAKVNKAVHTAIEQLPQDAWTPIGYCLEGGSDVAETCYRRSVGGPLVRLIVRQVRPTPSSRLALFTDHSYHACITDRTGSTLELEADHRPHAEVETHIREPESGMGLNTSPRGSSLAAIGGPSSG